MGDDPGKPSTDAAANNVESNPDSGAPPPAARAAQPPPKRLLSLSTLIIGLGTTAQVIGHIEKIEHFAVGLIGAGAFENMRMVLVTVVGSAIFAGYAAAAYWLYLKLRPWRYGRALAFTIPALFAMAGLAGASFLMPPEPDLKAFGLQEAAEWRSSLLRDQRPNGGVPVMANDPEAPTQVWTTAQALTGVLLGPADIGEDLAARVRKAFDYIDQARIADPPGGWGYFEEWQTGVTEIAGWVCVAEVAGLAPRLNGQIWPADHVPAVVARVNEVVRMLADTQQTDGGWGPTADRSSRGLSRTYSTAMALWCLVEARASAITLDAVYDQHIRNGLGWLMSNHRDAAVRAGVDDRPVGWVPNPFRKNQNERFLGLEAQVLFILSRAAAVQPFAYIRRDATYVRARDAFLRDPDLERRDLQNNNRLHDGDRYVHKLERPAAAAAAAVACTCPPFTVESSTFLWYPWSLAAARAIVRDDTLSPEQRTEARQVADVLERRLSEARPLINTGFFYIISEFAIGELIDASTAS